MATTNITTVDVGTASIERFRPLLDAALWAELATTMRRLAKAMQGRVLWNLNSTARGGGVAEILSSVIPYDRGCDIDERWAVIDGSPRFFDVTKRIHNLLHGIATADTAISEDGVRAYEETSAANAEMLAGLVRDGDVVIAHDPQTIGVVPALTRLGARVIWRCHIGVDDATGATRSAWRLLVPYLNGASAYVFSRREYAWAGLDPERVHVIAPTIDPFTLKNRDLDPDEVAAVLAGAGMLRRDGRVHGAAPAFKHQAALVGEPLAPDARIVMQVSRWDRLKDPDGLLTAFVDHVAPRADGVLVLAGPAVTSVDDDPEQPEVLDPLVSRVRGLPEELRSRVLIAQLPMADLDENAAMVNALQRRSDVVVQKSIAEGFGLTVAEAMWKSRPVVASRVGGIADQIQHGRSGLLVDDPRDLRAFGEAITGLLLDPPRAAAMGEAARSRAIAHFLTPRHLVEQARLVLSTLK